MSMFRKNTPPLLLIFFGTVAILFGTVAHAQINLSTNLQLQPVTVELIWEAHSYVPPLYAGKALYPISGEVTFLSFPPISLGNPNDLTYTWKQDGEVQGLSSGVGKRSYTFSGSQFGESPLITVEVSNGQTTAIGVTRINQTTSLVRLYENRPLQGVAFESTLPRTVTTKEKELTIEAYPYFFSGNSRTGSSLTYDWSANGKKLADATTGTITARSENPGTVLLQLSLNSTTYILQRASQSLNISFE
jgi:hypothetical protein